MATNWTNTAQQDYVLTLRLGGGIQTESPMIGIMSEESIAITYSPGRPYRDEIDAATLGRSVQGDIVSYETDIVSDTITTGNAGPNMLIANQGAVPTPTVTPLPDAEFSQSDVFTHTPPRSLFITRSRLRWWSGTVGSSNVVAQCWEDELVSLTPVLMEQF